MKDSAKLTVLRIIHTVIWLFFNVVMFYMLYAVISDKIGIWFWTGLGLFVLEGIVLFVFGFFCPLTIIARKYSNSSKENFDIYLPCWLAKYNKLIYTSLLVIIMILAVIRLIK